MQWGQSILLSCVPRDCYVLIELSPAGCFEVDLAGFHKRAPRTTEESILVMGLEAHVATVRGRIIPTPTNPKGPQWAVRLTPEEANRQVRE